MTGLYFPKNISPKNKDNVLKIFELLGKTLIVNSEKKLHSITALSGSGPAYFFNFYEALLSTGKELGLSKKEVLLLVKQTAIGATAMFYEAKEPINILRENVTSKGGTTEIALETLNKYEFAKGSSTSSLECKRAKYKLGLRTEFRNPGKCPKIILLLLFGFFEKVTDNLRWVRKDFSKDNKNTVLLKTKRNHKLSLFSLQRPGQS